MATSLPHALPENTVIDSGKHRYRIVGVLGAGGFGITYKARTPLRVGNVVLPGFFAIKEHFVCSDCERDAETSRVLCSNPARERVENSKKDFISEAQRLHRVGIDHPNIVRVNEVFEANNTAYYVMEYLDGESLRSYVRSHGPLPEDDMLSIMRPVIDAVGCLHSARMTHLDVKPDNIMLATNENGHMRPVLIDFGLSKHYDSDGHPTSTINTLGCSDGYAPVEQYTGITTFSPTADIYALGATMLFCLTGRDPKKSSEIRPGEINATLDSLAVSQPVREIISRAMTTSQFDRTQSVAAMFNNPVVGAGRALPANGGIPTIPLSTGERGMERAGIIDKVALLRQPLQSTVKPTQPISAKPAPSRRPLIIGAAIVAATIIAAITLWPEKKLGHGVPSDFDLACHPGQGTKNDMIYFTQSEWNSIPTDSKEKYHPVGVVFDNFIVGLDDLTSTPITWSEATDRYGSQLPSEIQGYLISKNLDEINRAISAFGGTEFDSEFGSYWTNEAIDPISGIGIGYITVSVFPQADDKNDVRAVTPIEGLKSSHIIEQPQNPVAKNPQGFADFELVCQRNGSYRSFSKPEWDNTADKYSYTVKGVVLGDFIVQLHDLSSENLTWDEAMRYYSSSLPTKEQGQMIARNLYRLNKAISDFGGDPFYSEFEEDTPYYWTKNELDNTVAWNIMSGKRYVSHLDKTSECRARGVSAL